MDVTTNPETCVFLNLFCIVFLLQVWRCDRGWQCLEAAQRSGPLLSTDSIGN